MIQSLANRPVAIQSVRPTPGADSSSAYETLRKAANEALGGLFGGSEVAPISPPYNKAETQTRLDAFRESNRSPYSIPSDTPGEPARIVKVRPQFQMEGGLNDPGGLTPAKGRLQTMANVRAALPPEALKNPALRTAVSASGMGRGTPAQIQQVTQALIDAGKLPPSTGDHQTDQARVRKLQWEFGLGTDCAGYVAQAVTAGAGRDLGLGGVNRNGDSLQLSLKPENFARINQEPGQPIRARAGDIIRLTDPTPGEAGHWVSVYDHTTMNAEKVSKLRDPAQEFWKGSDANPEVHVYTLDSSWGAGGSWNARGEQHDVGGVDRRKWVYNASNHQWGTLDDSVKPNTIKLSQPGPYDHLPDVKVYRPK